MTILLVSVFALWSFKSSDATPPVNYSKEIKWYTIEEAMAAHKEEPKKLFIDVYTDWCHWCKVMDKQTFTDAKVAAYLNENFYPVKFNAETRETVKFNGREYMWMAGGRRGVNKLAYALLGGRLGYPSFVYLNEDLERVKISPGFKKPEQMLTELKSVNTATSAD